MSAEKLAQDLKVIVHDAEDLIKATAGDVSEKAREARSRLKATLESAKETCARLQAKAVAGAQVADKTIRAHPYESIGLAFGLGLLIGVLVSRGRSG